MIKSGLSEASSLILVLAAASLLWKGGATVAVAQPSPNMVPGTGDGTTTSTVPSPPSLKADAPTTYSAEMAKAASSGRVTVTLRQSPPDRKMAVIKAVRAINGMGLAQAAALVESVPGEVLRDATPERAAAAKKALEDAGAVVEVR